MTLGENLQRLRKKKGLSQEEVAQELFVSRQTISKWETDKAEPGIENLKALAKLYGVTVDELLGAEPQIGELEREVDHRAYYGLVAFRVITVLMLALFSMNFYGSCDLPFDMIALVLGIWLIEPFMWIVIVCLEAVNIVFGAMGIVVMGSVAAVVSILVNVICIFVLCRPGLKMRFRMKRL